VHDFRQLPGASLGFGDLLALPAAVEKAFADGVVGAVVTQGTDTIEESSYALCHLLAARVQFLTEMLLIEVIGPPITRPRNPALYDVPLLQFGS